MIINLMTVLEEVLASIQQEAEGNHLIQAKMMKKNM
jgi:hypothetical protein